MSLYRGQELRKDAQVTVVCRVGTAKHSAETAHPWRRTGAHSTSRSRSPAPGCASLARPAPGGVGAQSGPLRRHGRPGDPPAFSSSRRSAAELVRRDGHPPDLELEGDLSGMDQGASCRTVRSQCARQRETSSRLAKLVSVQRCRLWSAGCRPNMAGPRFAYRTPPEASLCTRGTLASAVAGDDGTMDRTISDLGVAHEATALDDDFYVRGASAEGAIPIDQGQPGARDRPSPTRWRRRD
jgi:hypothetical protein